MKIFIIDDDEDIIEVMTAILEEAGHSVSSSTAGTEALPRISAQRPDCILTDLMMAELDGLELCREVRAKEAIKEAAVIMVSARDHGYWKDKAREAGADGYITKPLDPETFAREVEEIAAKKGEV